MVTWLMIINQINNKMTILLFYENLKWNCRVMQRRKEWLDGYHCKQKMDVKMFSVWKSTWAGVVEAPKEFPIEDEQIVGSGNKVSFRLKMFCMVCHCIILIVQYISNFVSLFLLKTIWNGKEQKKSLAHGFGYVSKTKLPRLEDNMFSGKNQHIP